MACIEFSDFFIAQETWTLGKSFNQLISLVRIVWRMFEIMLAAR